MTIIYRKWLVLLAGLIFFMLDRWIKSWLVAGQTLSRPSFLSYFENKNLAFSLPLPDFLLPIFYFFVILALLVLVGLFLASWRRSSLSQLTAYWLILVGAGSNLLDRFRFSAVIDFIDLKFWPVFNLADLLITAGIIILIFIHLRLSRAKSKSF